MLPFTQVITLFGESDSKGCISVPEDAILSLIFQTKSLS